MKEEKNSLDEILQSHNIEFESENMVDVATRMISLFKETDDIVYDITNSLSNLKEEEIEQACGKEEFIKGTTALMGAIMEHASFMIQSCQKLGLIIREPGNDDTDD